MPLGLMVAVPLRGPQKRDFSHAGTASTAVHRLRTRPNRMKPGFHLALARWKSRFTRFTAGLTFMINLSQSAGLGVSQARTRADAPRGNVSRKSPAGQERGP